MKKTRLYLGITLLCLLLSFACTHSHKSTSELRDIECAFDNSPSLAFDRLHKINPEQLAAKDFALYCLMLTEVQLKLDSIPSSDSIVNVAIKYYKGIEDSLRLSQSLYFKGKIFQQKKFLIQAIECYQQAREYVGNDDFEMKFLLNQVMGKIYHFKMMREEEKEVKEDALYCAKQLHDSLRMGEAFIELSKYYDITDSLENSLACLKQAFSFMPTYHYSE